MRIRMKLKKGSVWCAIKKAAQMQAKNTQDSEYRSLPAGEEKHPNCGVMVVGIRVRSCCFNQEG